MRLTTISFLKILYKLLNQVLALNILLKLTQLYKHYLYLITLLFEDLILKISCLKEYKHF